MNSNLVKILFLGLGGYILYRLYKSAKTTIDTEFAYTGNEGEGTIEQRIRRTVIEKGLPKAMQNLIVAQAKHETGNFTSNAFKRNNNLFGYKYVGSRYQLSPGITSSEGNAYGFYATIEDSVRELCDWIGRRQKSGVFPSDLSTMTASRYAQLLKSAGYYGDTVTVYTAGLLYYLA